MILTASRTSEIIEARWEEFEIQKGLWVIPAERMKMRRERRIPLTVPAIDVVKNMEQFRENEFVFPGQKRNKPLSNMAMAELIKGMDIKNVTVHGFRSSFRDWAGDESNAPREVIEGCLAHKVGDETERAYRRSDALEKKRILLNQWADYCIGQNNVVALRV